MRFNRMFATLAVASGLVAGSLGAQAPAPDPSARLREALPAEVAERVIARIAEARARALPAVALEQRALKFAARGVAPAAIERAIGEQAERMAQAKAAIQAGRGGRPADAEVEAGAEAIRHGVDGAEVSALAKSAPSGRSLAVPLYVVGSLMDRGLPSDQALQRVNERLLARATDAELERLPAQAVAGRANRPAETGRDLANAKRPGTAGRGGAPAGVAANAGSAVRPTVRTPVTTPVTTPTAPTPPAGRP